MPYLFGTGFEHGNELFDGVTQVGDASKISVSTSNQRTGARCLLVQSAYPYDQITQWFFDWENDQDEHWLAVGVRPTANAYRVSRVGFELTDGKIIEVKLANEDHWKAYVDGSLVATGAATPANDAYHMIELRVKIDDSSGIIQLRVDGVLDIDYAGDVKPSAATNIQRLVLMTERTDWTSGYATLATHFDDLTVKDDGWPGGLSYDLLLPTADTADADFTPSTGADNYALVDDLPASATDYVYTDLDAQKDLYAMGDWVGTDKTPKFLMQFTSAWKQEATADQLRTIVKSGATENASDPMDLTTSMINYWRPVLVNPDGGGEWNDAAIDGITAGFESIVT